MWQTDQFNWLLQKDIWKQTLLHSQELKFLNIAQAAQEK